MRLIEALRYTRPTCLAFVGAGGKTTALFTLAREIFKSPEFTGGPHTVLVTTSTHLGAWQRNLADHLVVATTHNDIEKLQMDLPFGIVLITGEENNQLLSGLAGARLDELFRIAIERKLPLLIEADGAHNCPLKAPAEHEPAIPDFTQYVIVVAGMSGLGKALTSDWVHRPEQFAALSGLQEGEQITGEALSKVLLDGHGGLKAIPNNARKRVLLNQADGPLTQSQASWISSRLVPTYEAGIVASLSPLAESIPAAAEINHDNEVQAVIEPIGGIILAAGGSSRFGTPKQLLLWRGMPLVRHVALASLKAGLSPVVVVIGNSGEEVSAAIKDLPLRIVKSAHWEEGISASIKAGLRGLPSQVGGAVFLQADQPQIPHTLIRSLIEAHRTSLNPIIAPQVDGQRGNPVLFDARIFQELLALQGDIGGRGLFAHHTVQWVSWHDPSILIDVDTPEDYTRFLQYFPPDTEQV